MDVTARRRAEASAAQFATIFAQSAIGIILADLDRHLLACNPAYERLVGYSEAELRQGVFPLAIHPDDAARDMALFRELAAGRRESYALEKRYIHRDGRIVQGRLIASLVRDAAGQPHSTIGMVEEITAQRAAEAGLTEAQHQIALLLEEAVRRDRRLHQQDSKLTDQEWAVMLLLAQGRKNAQIAQYLYIAVSTLKRHIHNINAKLGTENSGGIVAVARERGWVTPTGM